MSEVEASGAAAAAAAAAAATAADRLLAIEQLGALLSATTGELLSLVAEADRAEDWRLDGATGMAPWLVAALRVSSTTAREWVRTARALADLPAIAQAFAAGALTWEQVRPACRLADPAVDADADAALAEELPGLTVAQIEAAARERRPPTCEAAREAARRTRFDWRADHELGGFRYSGFLPTDRGQQLNQVLSKLAERVGPDPATDLWAPFDVRAAEALCELARTRAAVDPDPETSLVVVHVPADVVEGTVAGSGAVGDQPICREGVLRHLCDGKVEYSVDGPDGVTVGIGRADRAVPRWLRRRVARRDDTCRFPGCGRQIRHRHHLRHWIAEGPTDAANLVGLCWTHHHLVHEGGWTADGDGDREVTFVSPHGRRLSSRARPVDPTVRRRARRAAGLEDPPPPP